jgi:hypothetical protein
VATNLAQTLKGCRSWADLQRRWRPLTRKQKGNLFEELTKHYLLLEPEYAFTITSQATGKSLAIECDGPMYFQDEGETVYVDSDMERQEVLEKAGWQFYRIRYSDWLEKSEAREDLMRPIQAALLG